MDHISQACDNFDLTISKQNTHTKTKVAHEKPYSEPTITVNGHKPQAVDKFNYLGITLCRAVHIDAEVVARTATAIVAFGRLCTNVCERNGIRHDTMLKIYKTVVLSAVLYACETRTVYQSNT